MATEARRLLSAPKWDVWQGDAFDLLEHLPDKSVDLILTSPPYWGLRTYNLPHQNDTLLRWHAEGCDERRVPPYDWYRSAGGLLGLEPYPAWYVAHLTEFFCRARRVLKPDANVWVNLGDTYFARWASIRDGGRQGFDQSRTRRKTPMGGYLHDKQLLLVPARFAIEMQDAAWILRNDLIWVKPRPIPRPERDRLRSAHEHWFHFVGRTPGARPRYYYDLDECEPSAVDVVTCDTRPGLDGHTATFPPELVRRRIESSCPPGGLVLDPFCGSGTTLAEAVTSGRRAIGFDLSNTYAHKATTRLRGGKLEAKDASKRTSRR